MGNAHHLTCTTERAASHDRAHITADIRTNPIVTCAKAMQKFTGATELEALIAQVEVIAENCGSVRQGDFGSMEIMLAAQAQLLNTVFCDLTSRMAKAEYLTELETYGNLAMKSQHLCRKTVATLSQMKNPQQAVFIKNTAVNQQVNVDTKNSKDMTNGLLAE